MIQPGEKRITKAKKRIIVAVEHHCPNGPKGGQIEFYFQDEGPLRWRNLMGYRKWCSYSRADEVLDYGNSLGNRDAVG